jgi:hypothetical protein
MTRSDSPGGAAFLTQDEESSGIISAPFLGAGKYLLDVQAHYSIPGELVQGRAAAYPLRAAREVPEAVAASASRATEGRGSPGLSRS